jgi:hypothetical protein
MKRLSLRVRLTLLFFLLTSAAWGIACFLPGNKPRKNWISSLIPNSCCLPAD